MEYIDPLCGHQANSSKRDIDFTVEKLPCNRIFLILLMILGLMLFSVQALAEAQPLTTSKNQPTDIIVTNTEVTAKAPQWKFLHPYSAIYDVYSSDDKLGRATRKMTNTNGQWLLETKADISKYFIKLKSNESTRFQLVNNQLQTDWFYSHTKVTFKKPRVIEQTFDWKNSTEKGSKGKRQWQLTHQHQVFDRVSHIIQLREDLLHGKTVFDYKVSYKGKIHDYQYSIESHENIDTKMGVLKTIKLVRNKSNGDVFTLWLAPELNFIPVQIGQFEQDKPDVKLKLKSLTYEPLASNN